MNDKTRAATRGRASLSTSSAALETAHEGVAPVSPAIPGTTTDVAPGETRTEEPHIGDKRGRSDSVSSLSTLPVTSPALVTPALVSPALAITLAPAEHEYIRPPLTTNPRDAETAPAPAGIPPAHRATVTQPVPSTPTQNRNAATVGILTPDIASPRPDDNTSHSSPFQISMTPKYLARMTSEDPPAPHDLEPIHHTFHTDTPALAPNPNHPHRPTDATVERLQALRSQRARKCDPQDSLTMTVPTPPYGWPRVHHLSPDFLYTNLPDATLDKWLAPDSRGKKVIVQVMRQNSWASPQCDTTANLLVQTIEALFGIDKVKVATASEDIRGRSQQNAPFSFLVFGLPTDVAEKLLAKHCVATAHIQFLAYPLIYAGTPCFLGSISGLRNLGDEPDDITYLREDLTTILYKNPKMYRALLSYATEVAATAGDSIMDQDAAVIRVLHKFYILTLNTKTHGGIEDPTINLFIELPASTELDSAFPTFIDAASRIAFETPLTGTGRFFNGYACFNCRGTTHPTGLCPFENVKNWDAITRPDKGEANPPPPPHQPGAPPPPPSPRHPGPPPPRRDNHAGPSRLPAPAFRSSRGRPSGRG